MKAGYFLLIILICLNNSLVAQPDRWENNLDELVYSLQRLSRESIASERQILNTLQDMGFEALSQRELGELEQLLRQDLPAELLKRHMLRLSDKNFLPDKNKNASLVSTVPIDNVSYKPVTAAKQASISQVLEDFLVNDEIGKGTLSCPAIGVDASENFIITWSNRYYPEIHAQRFNSDGTRRGDNFLVINDTRYPPLIEPANIAVDLGGNFIITWNKGMWIWSPYGYKYELWAQRFDNSGNRQGESILVSEGIWLNDKEVYSRNDAHAIAIDGNGNFVIAWDEDRNGISEIYAQIYDNNGNTLGGHFRVTDDDPGANKKFTPSIAMNGSGNFVVVWTDYRNGNPDIYGQRYSSSGIPQGSNFKINDDTGSSRQWRPTIAVDFVSNFVVAWEDNRNGDGDIYAQCYNFNGSKQRANFRVNDDVGNKGQGAPAIAVDYSGNFVIVWGDGRNGNSDIYAQLYDNSGNEIGVNYRVNNDTGTNYQGNPDVKLMNNHIYYSWEDGRIGPSYQIFARVDLFNLPQDEFVLKRKLPDGTYEAFQVDKHGWPFGNAEQRSGNPYPDPPDQDFIMWPQYWWSQFDYKDPKYLPMGFVFHFPHPSPAKMPPSQIFPDWPLFEDTFGKEQCYNILGLYRGKAVKTWTAMWLAKLDNEDPNKRIWDGSCYGFAVSCFMAFKDPVKFYNHEKFKEIGQFNNLCELDINDEIRKIINGLFIYQFGKEQALHIESQEDKNPKETVNEIINMFESESNELKVLMLYNYENSSNHAVNPYMVVKLNNSDRWEIYVYDNVYPKDQKKKIIVWKDLSTWRWFYEPEAGRTWGGTKGLVLTQDIEKYYNTPILNPPKSLNNELLKDDTISPSKNNFITFYNSITCNISIEALNGETIGFEDSVVITNLKNGIPIIPATAQFHPPIGYFVADAHYKITADRFSDSLFYFSIFSDSVIYDYKRSDAVWNQTDQLTYNRGISAFNKDNDQKTANLEALIIEDQSDKIYQISNITLSPLDSVGIIQFQKDKVALSNYGISKRYSLNILYFSSTQQSIFKHETIELFSNTRHIIRPDWNDLIKQPVQILIDENMDGTIDDTLFIENQYTGIEEKLENVSKIPARYELMQNYPNPFNATTHIRFGLPKAAHVKIDVFTILGQHVAELLNENKSAGEHTIQFDSNNLSSGIYLYRMRVGDFCQTQKMILLK